MVASMMIRGEAAVGRSIRGMEGRVIERTDAILMAAQRRRLSSSLYERLWALRASSRRLRCVSTPDEKAERGA
jgi:hypothetical protein